METTKKTDISDIRYHLHHDVDEYIYENMIIIKNHNILGNDWKVLKEEDWYFLIYKNFVTCSVKVLDNKIIKSYDLPARRGDLTIFKTLLQYHEFLLP